MEDKSDVDRVYVDNDFYFGFRVFENWHVRLLLLGLGVIGTCSVLFIVPNARKKGEKKLENDRS